MLASSKPPSGNFFSRCYDRIENFILYEATFFRLHLFAFVFVPLISSAVFWACNGRFPISYLDSLFLCYSAMTVTGLSTVNLSSTTAWQQVILYLLMAVGDFTVVSWIMVLVRKEYFKRRCEYEYVTKRQKLPADRKALRALISAPIAAVKARQPVPSRTIDREHNVNGASNPNPNDTPALNVIRPTPVGTAYDYALEKPNANDETGNGNRQSNDGTGNGHMLEDLNTFSSSPEAATTDLPPVDSPPPVQSPTSPILITEPVTSLSPSTTRPQNVEFAYTTSLRDGPGSIRRTNTIRTTRGVPPARRTTILTNRNQPVYPPYTYSYDPTNVNPTSPTYSTHTTNSKKYQNHGGFPGPFALAAKAAKFVAPGVYEDVRRKVERKMTVPYTTTLTGTGAAGNVTFAGEKGEGGNTNTNNKTTTSGVPFSRTRTNATNATHRTEPGGAVGEAKWLPPTSSLVVGRNSDFLHVETMDDELIEEIGGIEYVALRWLSYLVPAYFIGTQLIAYVLFAPWLSSTNKYDSVFEGGLRGVSKPWFSLFQVMGAYTGGGLSLVDTGMVPFQSAYLMVFALMFVILAGNHALPIFLRLTIWVGSKITTPGSETEKAFSFLLDHPRRCFVYLFPSHQTWFLVICLVMFSAIEWAAFEVLDIGLEVWTALSPGPRIVTGLFQGLAARASGFSIVSISALAPAVQFLYVVMMYIAIYPVAMSIRSTNVYEEQSLGVFEAEPESEEQEPTDLGNLGPRQRVGRYIGWHLRRQMAVDIWWLVWGVFLIAIIERHNLLDEDLKWFDLFRVLFELVSAFGGIGLSLGIPTANYSFVGAMKPLSKLVVIIIMVRGRHRGLPVAVDRAVLLPSELMKRGEINSATTNGNINTGLTDASAAAGSGPGSPLNRPPYTVHNGVLSNLDLVVEEV